VTQLERRYAAFDGLNLTWETLEGIAKHNGPLVDGTGNAAGRYQARGVPEYFLEYGRTQDLELSTWPSLEAQVAAIADDIAYDAHDLDDGLRAGMFAREALAELPLVSEILERVRDRFGEVERPRLANELTRRLIARMIQDVVAETKRRVAALRPATIEDVRRAGRALAEFSAEIAAVDRAIKDFLMPRLYRHPRVMNTMAAAGHVVPDLFARYLAHSGDLPAEWRERIETMDERGRARGIADFIAGMTDRFALDQHRRFFDSTPELR
jgi:dGTPase